MKLSYRALIILVLSLILSACGGGGGGGGSSGSSSVSDPTCDTSTSSFCTDEVGQKGIGGTWIRDGASSDPLQDPLHHQKEEQEIV